MASKKVFLIGPGFIGSEILDHLLSEAYDVTALVRTPANGPLLQEVGAKVIMGSLDDKGIIQQQSAVSDIIFHTATADHLPSVEAVLDGVTDRAEKGKTTIFIHTSGTSLLSDDSEGSFKGDKVFQDDIPAEIDALPDTASHRLIDLAIVRAAKRLSSKAKLAIMIPPLIYGLSTRFKRLSIQLPTMARFAMKHGYAAHVGKGLSIWSQVHVADLARGYMALLHWLEQTKPEDVVKNPYFFCENGQELSWGDCAVEIGKHLYEAGRIDDPEPRTIPKELYDDLFGKYTGWVVGSNSRSRANRLRALGWEPREKTTFEALHEDEMPLLMEEKGTFAGYAGVAASGTGSSDGRETAQ